MCTWRAAPFRVEIDFATAAKHAYKVVEPVQKWHHDSALAGG